MSKSITTKCSADVLNELSSDYAIYSDEDVDFFLRMKPRREDPWRKFVTVLSRLLGMPVGERMSERWAKIGREFDRRLDARPARDAFLAGLNPGQTAAVYRRAEEWELWGNGYGSPYSPSANLIQESLRRRWSREDLLLIHKYFDSDRLPKNVVLQARMMRRLEGSVRRLDGRNVNLKESGSHWLSKLALKMRSLKGWLAFLGAVKNLCAEKPNFYNPIRGREQRDHFLELLRRELGRSKRDLIESYASTKMKWAQYGVSVLRTATTVPPRGLSGKVARKLLSGGPYDDDILQPFVKLWLVFGKNSEKWMEITESNVHDAGQIIFGDPKLAAEAGAYILKNFRIVKEKIKRGESHVVMGEAKRLIGTWERGWEKLTWAQSCRKSAERNYVGIRADVAEICAELKLSQRHAEEYQGWLKRHHNKNSEAIPPVTVVGGDVGVEGDWKFEKLDHDDLRGPLLGLYTDCCQHPNGIGAECAEHGWKSPFGAFFVVKYNGKIVAQSWAWRNARAFVFDNVEALGNSYKEGIFTLYEEAARKLVGRMGIEVVNVGSSHSDVDLSNLSDVTPERPEDYRGYCDSNSQIRLAGVLK